MLFQDDNLTPQRKAAILLALYSPDQAKFIVDAIGSAPGAVSAALNSIQQQTLALPSPVHMIKFHPTLSGDDVFSIVNGFSALMIGAMKQNWNSDEYSKLLTSLGFTEKAAKKYAAEIETEQPLKLSEKITNMLKTAANSFTFGWNPFSTLVADNDIMYELMKLGQVVREGMKHASLTTSAITSASANLKMLSMTGDILDVGDIDQLGDLVDGEVGDIAGYSDTQSNAEVFVPSASLHRVIGDVVTAIASDAMMDHVHGARAQNYLRPGTAAVLKTVAMRNNASPAFFNKIKETLRNLSNDRARWASQLTSDFNDPSQKSLRRAIRAYDVLKSVSYAPYLNNLRVGDLHE